MNRENINEAYRKLKGSVYYDKTLGCIREKIAEYEAEELNKKLDAFYDSLMDEKAWGTVEKAILDSIRVLTFPKNIEYDERREEDSPIVISNVQTCKTVIKKYNNFIDMNIEGFLAGILWVIWIGSDIDRNLMDTCYGNRLNENLVLDNGKVTASPNLFKPYFEQYETWRNTGLDRAKESVENGKNVIITMLDLTRYYYNVDLSKNRFDELTHAKTMDPVMERVNETVFRIFVKYSKTCGFNHTCLPIGFHPSNVLANGYLSFLDNKMQNIAGTIYYGRYVDDIMWVRFVGDDEAIIDDIHEKGTQVVSDIIIGDLLKNGIITQRENEYTLCDEKYLAFGKSKFRFFFLDGDGSKDLLLKIREDIKHNTSEFNFIPEEYAGDFSTALYKLDREDTVNKIRGITGATLDKYVLSKNIGKSVLMSPFTDDEQTDEFIESLTQLLDGKEIISNYLLWESMLNYFIVSKKLSDLVYFVASIVDAIKHVDEETCKSDEYGYGYLSNKRKVYTVKETLGRYLWSCLGRSLSIVWGQGIPEIVKEIVSILNIFGKKWGVTSEKLVDLRKAFIHSRMINKGLLPVTLDYAMRRYTFCDCGPIVYLSDMSSLLDYEGEVRGKEEYDFLPYINTPFDIGFTYLVEKINSGTDELDDFTSYVDYLKKEYQTNFPGINLDLLEDAFYVEEGSCQCISIKARQETQMRTAIANVRMNKKDIKDILDGIENEKSLRAKEIAELTNAAIKNNASFFVMPEAYVPLRFLSLLNKKSAEKQMAIVCGLEHVVAKRKVWNLTCVLVPFETNKVKYTIPFFRQKKYFSPDEERDIKNKGMLIPSSRTNPLFRWKGICFATYCCYELTSVLDRSEHKGKAEIICGVEWNRDVKYYSNIMESLSRDLYCYCVQANMSEYGDSRIIAPAHKWYRDILRVKGGENATVLLGTIDIVKLREAKADKAKREAYNYADLPAGM